MLQKLSVSRTFPNKHPCCLLDMMQAPQLCLPNAGSQLCPRGLPAALPGCRACDSHADMNPGDLFRQTIDVILTEA